MHEKILQRKQRAAPINYDSLNIEQQGRIKYNALDDGIVDGYSVIWNNRSMSGLKFLKGSCSRSIKEHGPGSNANYEIKFLNQHKDDDPLALHESIEEDKTGLHFVTKPLDFWNEQGSTAYRVLQQLRSKTLNNFSHGFDFIWDKVEYDESDDSLVCSEILLFENSVVSIPAGLQTRRIQSMEEIDDMQDEIDSFIKLLPSRFRMQARQLFTAQNALINFDSFEQRKKIVEKMQQNKSGIDYSYLIKNL